MLRPDAALLLPELAAAFDEPFADSSALPTYLVSRLAAEDVKVALSGEGGDELFGGYYTYPASLLAERFGRPAALIRPLVERMPTSTRKASLDYRAKRFVRAAKLPPLERHHGWKEIFSADVRAELTGRRSAFDPVDLLRARFAETEGADLLVRLQDVDIGTYLVDDLLVKTDRASMANSLEARVPFLDTVVSGFALALPARHKVRGLSKKRLLRKAAAPLLPERIVNGRKRGFSIPAAAWLRGDLVPFARETLAPDVLRRRASSSPSRCTASSTSTSRRSEDWSRQLWGLLSFTLWYEHHVERTPLARSSDISVTRRARVVRVWIDMTASAHVLVFRPLIAIMRGRGDEVEITARDYAQTLQLLELHGLEADAVIGRHGGRSRTGKARAMWSRLRSLRSWARGRDFDVALAHGSHELTMSARRLGIPSATTFDYEWAWLQHQLGCRAATRVVVPDAIPAGPPRALRRRAAEARPVRGPEGGVLPRGLRAGPGRARAVRRRPVARARRAAPAARRVAVPPAVEPALPADARARRPPRRRARDRPAAHRGAARVRARARAAVGDRPRARRWTRRA